jgi:hypothetical protein
MRHDQPEERKILKDTKEIPKLSLVKFIDCQPAHEFFGSDPLL